MPVDVAAGPIDWSTWLLWRHTNGAIGIWREAAGDILNTTSYGPFAGWTATAIAAPNVFPFWNDFDPRVLWTHVGGSVSVWRVPHPEFGEARKAYSYGPFAGWTALDIAVGPE